MSKEIPLSRNKFAIVDDEDYEWLMQWKWYFDSRYAKRSIWDTEKHKQFNLTMHKAIMNPPDGMEIDHINHNMIDNRRENLRIVSHSQNLANRRKFKGNQYSKYKGLIKNGDNWKVHLQINGEGKHLGLYSSEEAAANAYNYYAKIYFGEYAYLNDVEYIENWQDYFIGRKKSSIFKGVSYVKDTGRWMCRTPDENNKYHHLGNYKTELEAAHAYDTEIIRLFGINDPRLNFPVITEENLVTVNQ